MIYFDNAATTFPKPEEVYLALDNANRNLAFNAGRGEYKQSSEAFELIEDTRKELASLIKCDSSSVIFNSSATESLNLIINGIEINDGDYIYVSPFEHNAVIRPLKYLQNKVNFEIKILQFDKDTWEPKIDEIKDSFALCHPRAVFISHLSNVTGYLVPYENIFESASKYNSVNVLDCSQSLGVLNPNNISNISYIVFAGHKSLYASFGIAGFLKLKTDNLKIIKAGGTGSDSLNPEMPNKMPYKYEAGSPNIVAIAGLNASLKWLKENNVYEKENNLMKYLLDSIKKIDGVKIYFPEDKVPYTVLSINVENYLSDEAAEILSDDYDICVRAGYHCAPYVHDFIGSKRYNGTIRISLSAFNTKQDIDFLINAIEGL